MALFILVGTRAVGGHAAAGVESENGPAKIAEGTIDPEVWGAAYPAQYESWKSTAEPTPVGKSRYKRGFDTDGIIYNKIDEYPYLALLLKGWGYGVEFTEPRGHVYMVRDQLEVEPARLKAGGSCLSCKTPYAPALYGKMGSDYFSKPFEEVRSKIPAKDQLLGVACADCHQSGDLSLKISRGFTLGKALQALGKDQAAFSEQDKRSLVCAQCHVTYSIPKDQAMKSTDVVFPWSGGKWGDVSIENIIENIRSNPAYGEWTQSVTGFKLGFVRHPEFELFSRNSPHWQQGLSCADCHMPASESNGETISDHRIMSPLKNDLKACAQCHEEDAETLREKVFAIQDEVASLLIRNGYATARVAKLFELTHGAQAEGIIIDNALYDQAKDAYEEAFYRIMFIQNENSTGFHNPPETLRVLGDAKRYAAQADSFLRQALAAAKVEVPETVDLELEKYLNNRGEKKLQFAPEMEIKAPKGSR
ncbi:c-type cytochrome [Desulfuromonas versatilis]|uniref:nitrite reductase (cytochrome; ammonia-forming) n=1 Tax=Desulfuromonas versatilis TaxID=2802975 RepID=A0ABN6E3W5_9BACT|nr:c-type cytochrome [Desulfuromonas versatilis]